MVSEKPINGLQNIARWRQCLKSGKLILDNPASESDIKTAKLQRSGYDEYDESAEEEVGQ